MKTKEEKFKEMDPKNPDVIQARDAHSDYIVYASQNQDNLWNFERVSDKAVIASGSLQSMLALLTLFPNSRRASWSEDMMRYTPKIWCHAMLPFKDLSKK